jgi:hypothetical protein
MRYLVEICGHSWAQGPIIPAKSLREARELAESYGTTADFVYVRNRKDELCATYHRDKNDNGLRWFRTQ